MKLAFLITGLKTGGAEIMLYRLLKHTPNWRNALVISLSGEGELVPLLQNLGIKTVCVDLKKGFLLPHLLQLKRLLQAEKVDVISTWLPHADAVGAVLGKWLKLPVVWGIHASDITSRQHSRSSRWAAYACIRLFKRVPMRITCCSQRAQVDCVAAGYPADVFQIIPNGFDTEVFKPIPLARIALRQRLGLNEKTLLVGQIARFSPQKNHLGWLNAIADIHRVLPDVHFLFAGNGVDSNNSILLDAMVKHGLTQHVHLLGLQTDTPALLAGLDMVVSPSHFGEAFPLVLGEAMACGVPCVTTDVGDSAYLVGDTGYVVSANDTPALAKACIELLSATPQVRQEYGEQARLRIQAHFSLEHVTQLYQDCYNNAHHAFLAGKA